jgi:hypothetical protein
MELPLGVLHGHCVPVNLNQVSKNDDKNVIIFQKEKANTSFL